MNVQKWLERVMGLTNEVESITEEKEKAYSDAMSATRPMYGERVQTSRRNMSEELMIRYLSYCELLEKRLSELFSVKCEVQSAIEKINDPVLRTILSERYIMVRPWDRVAERVGKSRYHVEQRLAPKALTEIERLIAAKQSR